MPMIKLKPCPFCGADDQYLHTRGARSGPIGFIKCGVCGASTRAIQVLDETPRIIEERWNYDDPAVITLIAMWNMRAKQPANEEN